MSPGSQNRSRYDFAVYDRQGRLSAVVEAKRRFGTDESWARAWHAAVVDNTEHPAAANVVLFAPDRVYVWRPGAGRSASPDWTFEAGPWLAPYFARLKIEVKEVDPHVFEAIVGLWLQDVVHGGAPAGNASGSAEHFLDALRGGEVVQQAAA